MTFLWWKYSQRWAQRRNFTKAQLDEVWGCQKDDNCCGFLVSSVQLWQPQSVSVIKTATHVTMSLILSFTHQATTRWCFNCCCWVLKSFFFYSTQPTSLTINSFHFYWIESNPLQFESHIVNDAINLASSHEYPRHMWA